MVKKKVVSQATQVFVFSITDTKNYIFDCTKIKIKEGYPVKNISNKLDFINDKRKL